MAAEKHFNIQIHVQAVTPKQPAKDYRGTEVVQGGSVVYIEKSTVEVLSLVAVASSEAAAFDRAIDLLRAARPETDSELSQA